MKSEKRCVDTVYGFPRTVWEKAKRELREVLGDTARSRQVITIQELARRIKSIKVLPYSYALRLLLREVVLQEYRQGKGVLSVIVTEKKNDIQPIPEFFELISQIEESCDYFRCWRREVENVYNAWRRKTK